VIKIRRPRTNFAAWMKEKCEREFFNDLAWISYLAHKATCKGSILKDKRKKQLSRQLMSMITKRIEHVNKFGVPVQWDERRYRPLRRIRKELKL
jgi:hypothetical protein